MATKLDQLYHSWQFFEASVPILHIIAIQSLRTDRNVQEESRLQTLVSLLKRTISFPFSGGSRTLVFQILSWTLFYVSILLAFPVFSSSFKNDSPQSELLMASASFSAATSLLFMIKSMLLFDPLSNNHSISQLLHHLKIRSYTVNAFEWDVSRMPSRKSASRIIIFLGVLWSALGAALLFAASMSHNFGALSVLYALFSAICFVIAAFTTHGLGGHLRHTHEKRMNIYSSSDDDTGSSSSNNNDENEEPDSPQSSSSGNTTGSGTFTHQTSSTDTWRFYQPFKGGVFFVATQAAGWFLFSSALSLALWAAIEAAMGVVHSLSTYALAAGTTGVAAELILAGSLLTYNIRELTREDMLMKGHAVCAMLNHIAVLALLYIPVHMVVASVMLTFLVFPPLHASTLWVGGLTIYFSLTGIPLITAGTAAAEHSGKRQWKAYQDWLGYWAERSLPILLGSFDVVLDDKDSFVSDGNVDGDNSNRNNNNNNCSVLDRDRMNTTITRHNNIYKENKNKKYVFAYLPHGLYPLGAAYLPHTPSFRRLVPGIKPVTLTASVVFQLPILRDLLLWAGARAVNKSTFVHALREQGAVLVVPGGQAELVEAHRMPQHAVRTHDRSGVTNTATTITTTTTTTTTTTSTTITTTPAMKSATTPASTAMKRKSPMKKSNKHGECVIYSRHRGFVRLAISEGACLVPIVVFGEVTSLRNLFNAPKLQRWTYKKLGFPVPFIIVGLGGILPFPSRSGLKFVIGRPIEPPVLADGEQPSERDVDEMHALFYDAVERLWMKYRGEFPGYERIPLVRI